MKRDKIILITSAILAITGFIILVFVILFRSFTPNKSPVVTFEETNHPAKSSVNINMNDVGVFYNKAVGKRNLSIEDASARQKLVNSLKEGSGTLMSSPSVRLGYLKSPDFFQAEILITDVALAKKVTVDWLISRGISKDGICELPLMFFLGTIPAEELTKSREVFSPLAPGC